MKKSNLFFLTFFIFLMCIYAVAALTLAPSDQKLFYSPGKTPVADPQYMNDTNFSSFSNFSQLFDFPIGNNLYQTGAYLKNVTFALPINASQVKYYVNLNVTIWSPAPYHQELFDDAWCYYDQAGTRSSKQSGGPRFYGAGRHNVSIPSSGYFSSTAKSGNQLKIDVGSGISGSCDDISWGFNTGNQTALFYEHWLNYVIDNTMPNVSINVPGNASLYAFGGNYTFVVNNAEDSLSESCWYSLNGMANVTYSCNQNVATGVSVSNISNGTNTIYWYHKNDVGATSSKQQLFESKNAIDIQVLSPTGIVSDRDSIPLTLNNSFTWETNCSYGYFNITRGAALEVANTPLTTCSSATFDVSSDDTTYILNIWINDTSGNSDQTNFTFVVEEPIGGAPQAGGGGGGAIIILGSTVNWTMATDNGQGRYNLILSSGSVRTKGLLFENLGTQQVQVKLECVGSLCEYIDLEATQFSLPSKEVQQTTSVDFTLTMPENLQAEEYTLKFLATDQEGNVGELVVNVDISIFGSVSEFIDTLFTSTDVGGLPIPNLLIGLFAAFVIFLALNLFAFKSLEIGGVLSSIAALVSFILIIIFLN